MQKRLLIVHHSHSGNSKRLAEAACEGARRSGEVDICALHASQADSASLLACNGLLLATPENFGAVSGLMKDFLERTYYPCENRLGGLPYAVLISAGNDGRGAVRDIERIASGFGWKRVAEPLIVRGTIGVEDLAACTELGEAMASALAAGIF